MNQPGEVKGQSRETWMYVALLVLAFLSRLLAAFFIPNAELDGYSYAETITRWSGDLSAGHFSVGELYGFWPPLFPFLVAIPNIWIGNALLTGKILSALCGATSCLLVFAITKKLTRSVSLAWLGFALLLSSPFHILYSAACMTDVPHGCAILASVWCVAQRRWVAAAIFGALAEGMRIEAWVLVAALPILQFVCERRVSLVAFVILLLPPLLWLGICQIATGDPFAFFATRARYQANYLDFYPTRRGFAFADVRQDIGYFLLGANRGVVLASLTAACLSIWHVVRRHRPPPLLIAATFTYAVAFLAFILLSYLTKRQPVILPRYSLIFFVLGLPVLMWLARFSFEFSRNAKALFFFPPGEG